jgi:hypothetical protein
VGFGDGYVSFDDKLQYYYVRCVRGTSASQSFTDNGNGTLTDNISGRMWQREDDDMARTWLGALDYCNNLSLAGHADWRLPNIKELESITDDSTHTPVINVSAFPNTNSSGYWSSASIAGYVDNAWFVDFSTGYMDGSHKSSNYYVRCVR